ncbi:BLOC-1-related complex subunit 7-like [Biomphalaria glabrata]|uniref:BLOC-1-related complex subunit 7 n=1 Tax=Biomphalaria glabrata TaxID=6526 RepID=A0A9W2YZ12_BIOGL|nr:BLOC-1-related complex subunit 7-like [Biomphalaria glabrata]XP_055876687.1 BLOC-1-related complex subunit 7-like [Biomphalaria glabrata]
MATNRHSNNWNQETKIRLNEKVTSNINDIGSLARQVIRGSKSNEFLAQAAKNFASQENCIQNSYETMRKMDLLRSQLEFQYSAIERSLLSLDEVQDQIASISH